ncbi:hypothetical protein CTI12_AA051420 [Artemisia annua]|uniref:Uncharacterized protein n=1 Tax=Artemisia annua TaxID=35608 RepID=A0A2U1QBL7_ARTAN|nr:hypothetical protein CTI12_AA051420 [Artemisia annua]
MALAGDNCTNTVAQLFKTFNFDRHKEYESKLQSNLSRLCDMAYEKDADDQFSGPLVWIGVYIAIGSALCILKLVVADLLSDASRARQIPYKWFSLNAATVTVLGVAMKLPLDMTGSMPGLLDQTTKLGSLVFMCTMLANLIPNLASMDVKTLKSNLVALAILVITIIVNISIEIHTGVIGDRVFDKLKGSKSPSIQYMMSRKMPYGMDNYFVDMAIVYTVWLFFLLMASVSAAVAIPSMKKVLESKYQVRRKALSEEPTTLVELEQHVTRYWIMAKTGSPQLVLIASPLIVASGAICIASTITYAELIRRLFHSMKKPLSEYLGSDYEWSMLFILITQGIGIIVGDFILILRYINSTSIKLNSYYSLRVEKFWYVILIEWQARHIAFPKGGRRRRTYVHTVKNSFLNLWILIQFFVIQICKIIGLIPFIITHVIKMIWCRRVASRENHEDLINNVLQVEDKVKNDKYAFHFLLKIRDELVQKAKKKDTSNLVELLRKSNVYKEGQKFAIDQVQIPPSVTLENWSIPVITLTCIAMVVPDSKEAREQIKGLLKSVDQALAYTHHVEEVFNSEDEYTNMGKKTMDFWYEVTDKCRWLKTDLKRKAFKGKTPTQILKWFDDKAKEAIGTSKSTVVDVEVEPLENYPDHKLMICKSMQSISRSILTKYENRSQLSTKVDFFELLSSMIADILFACFSNIPQAVTKKCQVKEIEKREASVEAAVKILARTTKILEMFGTPKLPVLDQDKMAYDDEWRHPFIQLPTDPELR